MKFGYTLFYVSDVPKTMDFYEKAFGLKKGFSSEDHQYGEMVSGETKIGFVNHKTAGSNGFSYQNANPKEKPFAFEIGFLSADVEGAYNHALRAGATPVTPPKKKPWGQVVSYVRDCNGFLVEICSPMGE